MPVQGATVQPMTSRVLAWLAFGLMASGIILGFIKLDVGNVKCGSLFTGQPDNSSSVVDGLGDDSGTSSALTDAACSQQRTEQWRTATPLLVVGVFLGLGAAHVSDGESKRQRAEQS